MSDTHRGRHAGRAEARRRFGGPVDFPVAAFYVFVDETPDEPDPIDRDATVRLVAVARRSMR